MALFLPPSPPGITRAQSAFLNATRPLICANNCTALAAKRAGTNTTDNGRLKLTFGRSGYHSVRVALGNFYQTDTEKMDLDTIAVRLAMEFGNPSRNRVMTFAGQRVLNLEAGDLVFSDALPAEFAGGEEAWLRTFLSVPTVTNGWPVWRTARATGEGWAQHVGGENQAYSLGAISTAGGSSGQGFAPLGVIGVPHEDSPLAQRRAVICDGDSIMAGTGDTADTTTGNIAYTKALLDGGYTIPYVNQARAADQLSFQRDTNTTPRWRKQQLWAYATHYLCNFGTNDINAGRTLAEMQADITYLWTRAKKYGLTTAHITVLPRQVSVGGAVHASWGVGGLRDQWNAWLATQVGNGLLDALIDPNPLVESASTHGAWVSDAYTTDGLHMTAAGYAAANPAVTAWVGTI